nr:molybdopterin-dependent oxidoreductase [Anaerobacillus isosaccharinicus]QOY35740.1 molybdopterin-dependent oxidoreductase [Anaerobacillus isosaccharinicus]
MGNRQEVKMICSYCGTGCNLITEIEDNKIVKVRGDKEGAVNKGQTCIKGAFAFNYVHAEDRLTSPLLRKNGELQPVSWKEALSFIAEKLTTIKKTYGPDSMSIFACARATNEVNYVTQKFARAVLGMNNIDGCNRT